MEDRAIFGGMLACDIAVLVWYMGAIMGWMADSIAASAWNHKVACYWMAWHAAVGAKPPSVFGSFVDLGSFGLILIDESRASVAAGVRDCISCSRVCLVWRLCSTLHIHMVILGGFSRSFPLGAVVVSISMFLTKLVPRD